MNQPLKHQKKYTLLRLVDIIPGKTHLLRRLHPLCLRSLTHRLRQHQLPAPAPLEPVAPKAAPPASPPVGLAAPSLAEEAGDSVSEAAMEPPSNPYWKLLDLAQRGDPLDVDAYHQSIGCLLREREGSFYHHIIPWLMGDDNAVISSCLGRAPMFVMVTSPLHYMLILRGYIRAMMVKVCFRELVPLVGASCG